MATDKNGVVIYADWITTFEKLTDEEAGKLVKHLFRYVNDLEPNSDRITELLFEPFKQTLKRDLCKWEKTKLARSEAGKKGGVKSGETRRNKTKQNETNEAVSVSVSVSDSVINIEEQPLRQPKIDINGYVILD